MIKIPSENETRCLTVSVYQLEEYIGFRQLFSAGEKYDVWWVVSLWWWKIWGDIKITIKRGRVHLVCNLTQLWKIWVSHVCLVAVWVYRVRAHCLWKWSFRRNGLVWNMIILFSGIGAVHVHAGSILLFECKWFKDSLEFECWKGLDILNDSMSGATLIKLTTTLL